jgi:hypothetical protein
MRLAEKQRTQRPELFPLGNEARYIGAIDQALATRRKRATGLRTEAVTTVAQILRGRRIELGLLHVSEQTHSCTSRN